MTYVLNLIYIALLVVLSPWLLWRSFRTGRYREGWPEKTWGAVTRRPSSAPAIWIHAVSVGEVRVAATLAESLREQWPDHELIVTTTTQTGYQLARRSCPSDLVSYAPLDFSWAVRRAFRRWRPSLLILVELELWPNLLSQARRQKVPVAIVNGRLSDSSYQGYRSIRPIVARWFQAVDVVAAQNTTYAYRFQQLGARPDQIHVTGSIKFDGVATDRENPSTTKLRALAGLEAAGPIWVAGSTQAPEERIVLETYCRLVQDIPRLRLILVPRHPERFDEVAALLTASGQPYTRWTEYIRLQSREARPQGVESILLVDQVGDLRYWWGLADVAYVGGSLSRRGGQNMIEPAAFGVPVCFGPSIQNFADVVELLLAAGGAELVRNGYQLEQFIGRMLRDPKCAVEMGRAAAKVVHEQQGASQRTVTALSTLIQARPPFDRPPKSAATFVSAMAK